MTKKKDIKNWLSYLPALGFSVTIIGFLITGVTGYNKLQARAETTKEKVEELKTDTKTKIEKVEADIKDIANEGAKELTKVKEENEKDIDELKKENATLDKAVVAQTVQLKNIEELLKKIDDKLEKKK